MLIARRLLFALAFGVGVSAVSAQSFTPRPDVPEAGAEFVIRAIDGDEKPASGIEVFVRRSPVGEGDDGAERLGVTDADGVLRARAPESTGTYRLEGEIEGIRCVTPLHVIEPLARWPYAILGAVVAAFVVVRLRSGARDAGPRSPT